MARSAGHIALFSALLISAFHGTSPADWDELTRSMNRMTQDINEQVQRFTQQLHRNIERTVQGTVQPALERVNRIIENLPRDEHGRIINTGQYGGNTIIVNSGNGMTRSIISGHTRDGEPFVRDVEEQYVGNVLYHNETSYNPRSNSTERIRWKLDLSTPGAKPEFFTDEN